MTYFDGKQYHASVNGIKIGSFKTQPDSSNAIDRYKNRESNQRKGMMK